MREYSQLLINALDSFDCGCLFNFYYDFPEDYKPIFEKKFLMRYAYRNISFDSFQMFKHQLEAKLNELMPYYNQLYKSVQVDFNPFINNTTKTNNFKTLTEKSKNYETNNNKTLGESTKSASDSHVINGAQNENENTTENNVTTSNNSIKTINDSQNKFLNRFTDTPQTQNQAQASGGVGDWDGVINDGYLTTASKDDSRDTELSSSRDLGYSNAGSERGRGLSNVRSESGDRLNQEKSADNFISYNDSERVSSLKNSDKSESTTEGLNGVLTSEAVIKWRESFINVDKMLLDEFETFFMDVF